MHIHPTEYGSSVLCIGSPAPPGPWGIRVRPFVEKYVYAFYALKVLFQAASTLIRKIDISRKGK